MGLYINSAVGTLKISRNLYQTSVMQTNIMKKLSSGIRINSASDDAAGLSLSQKLTSVINGNTIAKNNAQNGIAFLNTADSALSVMTNSLERIRQLAVQAANGVYTDTERQMLQNEVGQLSADISQSYQSAKFSNMNVFQAQGTSTTTASAATQMTEAQALANGYDANHIIHNATEFISKVVGNESDNFILVGNVDMSSLGVLSKSAIQGAFSGTFDGNGYAVSNMNINSDGSETEVGLFSSIIGGTVKNLSVLNSSITYSSGGAVNIGLLAAYLEGATADNCYSSGSITATAGVPSDVGGLIGATWGGATITNCGTSANVTGGDHNGGLLGHLMDGSIVDGCYATGDVSNPTGAVAGGLVGLVQQNSTVTNSYATGNVSSPIGIAGGLTGGVGGWGNGSVTNSYAAGGNVSGAVVGGFTGEVAAGGTVDASNFYKNNLTADEGSAVDGDVSPLPTGGWDTSIWDFESSLPRLKFAIPNMTTTTSNMAIQVGSEADNNSRIALNTSFDLGTLNFDVANQTSALQAIDDTDTMMTFLNTMRSNIGASVNKLSSIITIQDNRINNLSQSRSTIKDTDIAQESANLIRNQIRQQAGVSLLSRVNSLDKNLIMELLG